MKPAPTIVLGLLLLSGTAQAEQAMVVKVRDLNLHTRAGAFMAVQRMDDAAAAFCTTRVARAPIDLDVATLRCRRDLATRAAAKLRSPEVVYLQSRLATTRALAAQSVGETAAPPVGATAGRGS